MIDPIYYRNRMDGQRGTMVVKDGKSFIKLDRAMEEILVPYSESEWTAEKETRKLNKYHVAKTAFVADIELCKALGIHTRAKLEWETLREEERIAWAELGPRTPPKSIRHRLFTAIMGVLKPHASE